MAEGVNGAEDGIRTRDPVLGKDVRYRCATSAGPLLGRDYTVSGAFFGAALA